jgi:hypothetical protein
LTCIRESVIIGCIRESLMPKPRLYGGSIKVRFPEDDYDRLTRLAKRYEVPIADLVRACVRRALPYVEGLVKKGHVARELPSRKR